MKFFFLLLFISISFAKTDLHKKLLIYLDYFNNNGLEIDFVYSIESDLFSKKEKCNIKIDKKKHFIFEMGPKKLFYNGIDFRTFDSRTNQLFIQDPDTSILNSIKIYLNEKYISNLKINQIDSNNYEINDEEFSLSLNKENSIYRILFKNDKNLIKFNAITIKEYNDSINFNVIDENEVFYIDMRSK